MPFLKIDTASKRERRKNGDSTNPSRVDEFTGGESKGGALTENKVRSGTRHGGAAGAQEQGLYHRLGDAAMLAPAAPPPSHEPRLQEQGSKHSLLPEVWATSPKICA